MKKLTDLIKENKWKSLFLSILLVINIFVINWFVLFCVTYSESSKEYYMRKDNIEHYNNLEIKEPITKDIITKEKENKPLDNKPTTTENSKDTPKEQEQTLDNQEDFSKKKEQELTNLKDIAYVDKSDVIEKIGQFRVDTLNLTLPIFKGIYQKDGEDSMMYGAITNKKGQEMGKRNYILSSHKAFKGQLFSEIYLLEKGDLIEISDNDNTYVYSVYGDFEIEETENWILKDLKDKDRSILTLYTCLTTEDTDIRTVVRAELIEVRTN